MTHGANPYLEHVESVLPRLLALYDTDPTSPTHGYGDRFHWGWKLIDFANGTFQGAAHGLARLVHAGLLPEWLPEASAITRIDAMFRATGRMTRRDGSLEEAFPFEGSFCVTALVAYDLLAALELLGPRVEADRQHAWLDTIRPLVAFIRRRDEGHAPITNHLATAAAALFRWSRLSGEGDDGRARALLERILSMQSGEGWYREYQGADPGYQSLATCYLADIHLMRPDLGLADSIDRSLDFLARCAHPDGSFGGLYGSRNTRILWPAGVEALAPEFPAAASLAAFMQAAVVNATVPTLNVVDEPNLVPLFNAYCRAAELTAQRPTPLLDPPPVPALRSGSWRLHLPEAGLVFDKGPHHYTVVSTHKGGVCCHWGDGARIDPGVALTDRRGRWYSAQAYNPANRVSLDGDELVIEASITRINRHLPGPWQFLALRLLNVTLMRLSGPREAVKRLLVHLLITGSGDTGARNRRTIRLGENLQVEDRQDGRLTGLTRCDPGGSFSVIHMASQGYWQVQDDQ